MKFNTQINKIQNDLINLINNSGLPVAVIRLILESVLVEIKNLEKNVIEQESTQKEQTVVQAEENN